jgi:hypothetical protein
MGGRHDILSMVPYWYLVGTLVQAPVPGAVNRPRPNPVQIGEHSNAAPRCAAPHLANLLS